MTVEAILQGQIQALRRIFYLPVVTMLVFEAIGFFGGLAISSWKSRDVIDELFISGLFAAFYLFWSVMEMMAAAWTGMWQGLICKSETQAIFKTILYILILPMIMSVFWCLAWLGFMIWPLVFMAKSREKLHTQFRDLAAQRFAPESTKSGWWRLGTSTAPPPRPSPNPG
jgi:hypothetical protein